MKRLFFIRHGESEGNKTGIWTGHLDSPLSEEGKLQAEAAGEKMKAEAAHFDAIFCSPLSRAKDTAQIVAQAIGFPAEKIEIIDELIERHFGDMEGTSNKEAMAAYLQHESMIDTYPGVESLADMQKRTQKVLDYLRSRPEENILIVGHGAFARTLHRTIEGIPLSEKVDPYPNATLVQLI